MPASFYLRLLALDGSEPVVDAVRRTADVSAPSSPSTPRPAGRCATSAAAGTSISADALALLRRIVGGDLAAVLREADPPGRGRGDGARPGSDRVALRATPALAALGGAARPAAER